MFSQSSSTDLPVGTILPYVGDIADIPEGWALCDGSNGTPDLRNRFLEGTTTKANMFVDAGLPSLTTDIDFYAPIGGILAGYTFGKQIDTSKGFNGANFDGKLPTGQVDAALYARTSGGGSYFYLWMNKFSKLLTNTGLYGISNTVQPASYTVYYIIRII